MTEEEIKQNQVLPRLLRRLGYRVLQVSREASVRTGSSTIRADLVFFDGGAPYLVVETKAPDKITAESILQAESYAILLHAPYFLVTDGRRWHWYQTGKDGGGSSRYLDCEVLPRHGRSKLFLADVERQPPPAPRPATRPKPPEPPRLSALPDFLTPTQRARPPLPPRVNLPQVTPPVPPASVPAPEPQSQQQAAATSSHADCAAGPNCLSPYHAHLLPQPEAPPAPPAGPALPGFLGQPPAALRPKTPREVSFRVSWDR